jgi:hypothetical protein
MKPRTFFGLALLTPYLLWVICVLILILLSLLDTPSDWGDILVIPFFYFAFGIFLWFIPYNLLAIGMWFWSRGKTTKVLRRLALTSPVLLSLFMVGVVLWMSFPIESLLELTMEVPSQLAVLGGFSLFFGYVCVGIAFGIYKILEAKNLITEGTSVAAQV